jgi:hypothetical protein
MLAERHHGARLRAFRTFGMLRHEAHLVADRELVEPTIGNAVAVKIDLVAVRAQDEAAILPGQEPRDPPVVGHRVQFDIPARLASAVFEQPAGRVKGVADRDIDILMRLVCRGIMADDDLASRDLQVDAERSFSEKHLGRIAEQHLADSLIMRVARLDLLGEGADVAEAALERAPRKDRVDAGGLVSVVRDRNGARNRVRAGEPGSCAVGDGDRGGGAGAPVDVGNRVEQIGSGGAEPYFGAGSRARITGSARLNSSIGALRLSSLRSIAVAAPIAVNRERRRLVSGGFIDVAL